MFPCNRKLYLMEPLCQTQMPAGGHDSSELLGQLEAQETKVLECEQRCRKILSDLQKVGHMSRNVISTHCHIYQSEERRQAFENDVTTLRKQLSEQAGKHQRLINERDAKINMMMEQYK
jgi:hypothetical protein